MSRPIIEVPAMVVGTLAALSQAVNGRLVMAGGWAVACRLRMGGSESRPTEDLDLMVATELRPAAEALAAIDVLQHDSTHPCRLSGLPLLVDLLATEEPIFGGAVDGELVTDPDGLNLLVPPFARLLAAVAQPVILEDLGATRVEVGLPLAGALLAAKVANIALEHRAPKKRASDGEDACRLLTTFGALAILDDLHQANSDERRQFRAHLTEIGASGLAAQSKVSGSAPSANIERAVALLVEKL